MADFFDYLEWRGDLPFEQVALNEVDALVFAWLSYYEFEKLDDVSGKTLPEIVAMHTARFGKIEKKNLTNVISAQTSAEWLLYSASQTERYANVTVTRFDEEKDLSANIQFAAVTFMYSGRKECVAFRGTDMSVAGWKEDCMLSYAKDLPAQRYALAYLDSEDLQTDKVITGHSKGGNLAMYSALHCSEQCLNTINRIYNFDGPGFFSEDMLETSRYREKLRNLIISIVPKSSIVGMLLNHEDDYLIVDSEMVSMIQHNAMLWQIKGGKFQYLDKRSASSELIDTTLTEWINTLSLEKRENIVENLFGVIESTGITEFSQLTDNVFSNIITIIKGLTQMPSEDREMITKVLLKLGGIGTSKVTQAVVNNSIVNDVKSDVEETVSSLTDTLHEGKNKLVKMFRTGKDKLFK